MRQKATLADQVRFGNDVIPEKADTFDLVIFYLPPSVVV